MGTFRYKSSTLAGYIGLIDRNLKTDKNV